MDGAPGFQSGCVAALPYKPGLWDPGMWTQHFQPRAWASTPGFTIAGPRSLSHAHLSVRHCADLLMRVCGSTWVHAEEQQGLDTRPSGPQALTRSPGPECLLLQVSLICVGGIRGLGLKPESDPGLRVQCRHALHCLSVHPVFTTPPSFIASVHITTVLPMLPCHCHSFHTISLMKPLNKSRPSAGPWVPPLNPWGWCSVHCLWPTCQVPEAGQCVPVFQ